MSKNSKYIIALAALLITSVANATVRTLNNNNPSPGQYTTYATAEAASAMNDTIYVSGSPISYGDITVNKYGLLIMGTGHNPQKQNPLVSKFGEITALVGNVRLDGIVCNNIGIFQSIGTVSLNVSNSYIDSYITTGTNGFDAYLVLHNNIIGVNPIVSQVIEVIVNNSSTPNTSSLKGDISNNIIGGHIIVGNYNLSLENDITDCYIYNNLFINTSFSNQLFKIKNFVNGTFSNNIVLGFPSTHGISSTSGVVCEKNLVFPTSFSPALPNSTGTIISNPLFAAYPCGTWNCEFDYAYDYHLSPASPGHNAGTDGTDIGPYGGPYGATFTTFGEPHIPQMKQMNMPATVVSGQTFNVNVISTVK